MSDPIVVQFAVPPCKQFSRAFRYLILFRLPVFLTGSLIMALGSAWPISSFGIPFFHAFVGMFVFATVLQFFILYGKAWSRFKKKIGYIPEDHLYNIDVENRTLEEKTAAGKYKTSFYRFRRCRRFSGCLVLECSQTEIYFLEIDAFPSMAALDDFVTVVRQCIRDSGKSRVQVIPPTVNPPNPGKKSWWKGCLLGCGIIFLVSGLLFGILIYRVVKPLIPVPVELKDRKLAPDELAELSTAFSRLDKTLKKNAPGLIAKRKPMNPKLISRLRSSLQGKQMDDLNMWYAFFSGMDDCELVPGGRLVGIDFAIHNRELHDNPLIRMTAPFRSQSMMLLHDGAGDGYFLGITEPYHFVYWDMLEDPGMDMPMGALAVFINLIADSIEKRLWTYRPDGRMVADGKAASEFMEKAMQCGLPRKPGPLKGNVK